MAYTGTDLFYKIILLSVSLIVHFLLLELLFNICKSTSPTDINKHLELGRNFLATGQLSEALSHYHAAVEGEPNNYLTYFKRGIVYLALGKAKSALRDLDKVLEMKPHFTAARLIRGNVHLKQANFDYAHLDFYNILSIDPYNVEANDLIHRIEPARENYALAQSYYEKGDFPTSIQFLTKVSEISPWSSEIKQLRADCYMKTDQLLAAVGDFCSATKLQSDNTEGYYKLATLLYELGEATKSLTVIRKCLKLDPEHKDCFSFYKKVKKAENFLSDGEMYQQSNDYEHCIDSAKKALKVENDVPKIVFTIKQLLCTCYVTDEQSIQAIESCGEALEITQEPSLYCDKAEAYIQIEMFDDAIRDYKSALNIDESFKRAKKGLQRAQKLQHQAEKKDYYKILAVKRTAYEREIIKAYRKMAKKWHPDHFQGEGKKIAEKKFLDIAAAKEVLTDPEKRQQFDNSEDLLDPEQGAKGRDGFHGFPH